MTDIIIKRLKIETNCASQASLTKFNEQYKDVIIGLINKYLEENINRLNISDSVIEKLEFHIDFSKDDVPKVLGQQINQQLSKVVAEAGNQELQYKKDSTNNALLYYLEKGYLPWNAHSGADAITDLVIEAAKKNTLKKTVKTVIQDYHSMKRLIESAPLNILDEILEILSPQHSKKFRKWIVEFKLFWQIDSSNMELDLLRRILWVIYLDKEHTNINAGKAQFLTFLLYNYAEVEQTNVNVLLKKIDSKEKRTKKYKLQFDQYSRLLEAQGLLKSDQLLDSSERIYGELFETEEKESRKIDLFERIKLSVVTLITNADFIQIEQDLRDLFNSILVVYKSAYDKALLESILLYLETRKAQESISFNELVNLFIERLSQKIFISRGALVKEFETKQQEYESLKALEISTMFKTTLLQGGQPDSHTGVKRRIDFDLFGGRIFSANSNSSTSFGFRSRSYLIDILEKLEFLEEENTQIYDQFSDDELLEALWTGYLKPTNKKQFHQFIQKITLDSYLFELLQHVPVTLKTKFILSFFNITTEINDLGGDVHSLFYDISRFVFVEIGSKSTSSIDSISKSVKEKKSEISLKIGESRATRLSNLLQIASTQSEVEVLKFIRSSSTVLPESDDQEIDSEIVSEETESLSNLLETENEDKEYTLLDKLIYFLKFSYFPSVQSDFDFISWQFEVMDQIQSQRIQNSSILQILQNKGARLRFFGLENEEFQEFILLGVFSGKHRSLISKSIILLKELKKRLDKVDYSVSKTIILELVFSSISKEIELGWVDFLAVLEDVLPDHGNFEKDSTKQEIASLIERKTIVENAHTQQLYEKSQLLDFASRFLSQKLPSQFTKHIVNELYGSFHILPYSQALVNELLHWILQKSVRYLGLDAESVKKQILAFSEGISDKDLINRIKVSTSTLTDESISLSIENWEYLQQLHLVKNTSNNLFERVLIEFLLHNFHLDQSILHRMVEVARTDYKLIIIPVFSYASQVSQIDDLDEITIHNWLQYFYELNKVVQELEKLESIRIRVDGFIQEIVSGFHFSDFNNSISQIFKSVLKSLKTYVPVSKVTAILKQHDYKIVRLLVDQNAVDSDVDMLQSINLQEIFDEFRTSFETAKISSIAKSIELRKQILLLLSDKDPALQLAYLQYLIAVPLEKQQFDEVLRQIGQFEYKYYQSIQHEVEMLMVKWVRQIEKEGITNEYSTLMAIILLSVDFDKKLQKEFIEKVKTAKEQQIEQVFIDYSKLKQINKTYEERTNEFWRNQFETVKKLFAEEVDISGFLEEKDVATSQQFYTAFFAIIDRLAKPDLKKVGLKLSSSGLHELGKQILRIAERSDMAAQTLEPVFISTHKDRWRFRFLVQTTLKELLEVLDKSLHGQVKEEFKKFEDLPHFDSKQETILAKFYDSIIHLVKNLGDNYKVKLSTYATTAPLLNTLVTQFGQKKEEQPYSQVTSDVADFFFANYSLQNKERIEEIYQDDLKEKAFEFATHFLVQLKSEIELLSSISTVIRETIIIVEKTLFSLKKEEGLSLHNVRSYLVRNFKLFATGNEEALARSAQEFEKTTSKKLPYLMFFLEFMIGDQGSMSDQKFIAHFTNLILKSEDVLKEPIQTAPQLTHYQQMLLDEIIMLSESRRSIDELRFINALQSSVMSNDPAPYVNLILDLEEHVSAYVKQFIYDDRNLIANYLKTIAEDSFVISQVVQYQDVLVIQEFVSTKTKMSKKEVADLQLYDHNKTIDGYIISTIDFVSSKQALERERTMQELYSFARLQRNEKVAQQVFKLLDDSQKQPFETVTKGLLEKQKQDLSNLMKADNIEQLKTDLIQRKYDWAEEIEEGERLYIENAGLIIFTQFVEAFFNNLGYLNDDRQFISYKEQERAVCILQYLATGQEEFREHLLVLNKLICGMDITNPLLHKVILNTKEKEEVNKLFNAVISNWPVVSKSSQDAIRETFINREGVVYLKDRDWNLKVEHLAVDRLMIRIPWGFATIKLPWNKYIIFTEWI